MGKRDFSWMMVAVGLILGVAACNKPLTKTASPVSGTIEGQQAPLYPHSADFKTTHQHGKEFFKNTMSCKTCHGEDLKGGNSKVSCSKCHSAGPHTDEFKYSFEHGKAYLADRGLCSQCHRTEAPAGSGLESFCLQCHDFPHPRGNWFKAENHGQAFLKQDKMISCSNCHNADSEFKKRHSNQFVSCDSCHLMIPHMEGWDMEHAAYAADSKVNCTMCHKEYKRNMPNYGDAGGCFACHAEGSLLKLHWSNPASASKAPLKKEWRKVASEVKKKPAPHKVIPAVVPKLTP